MKGDLDLVKNGLVERIEDLCRALLPAGKREGEQWVAWNPLENDQRAGRLPAFKVRLRNGVVGAWKDWRSGAAGDVIKLVAYLQRTDTAGALAWARDFLGIRKLNRDEREALRRVAHEKRERREKDDARRRERKLVEADRLFNASGQGGTFGPAAVPLGTAAIGAGAMAEIHAREYFRARGVPLEEVDGLNVKSFRFSAQTEWWRGAVWQHGLHTRRKERAGPLFPAVHAAMRNKLGIVTCCHVTFLDPLLPAKAPVAQPKLMFGEALGAVIEVSSGPAKRPFWWCDRDNEEARPLVVCEGIETALSFAVHVPEARVWACGSLSGIAAAPVDHPCVAWVLFARDNNTGNAQAQKQFAAALDGLEASGKRVVVGASHVGDDFNDLANGKEDDTE